MQSKDIIEVLESEEAKSFILKHINDDFTGLSLKYSGKTTFNIAVCLQLMELYSKAKNKIPLFYENLLALDKRSFEQSTSQKVAMFKATLLKGESLLDLTGGIGVDSIFLSKSFLKIDVIERNSELHAISIFNLQKLGIQNITRFCDEGRNYISSGYSYIYIDPDRRKDAKRSVILEDLEPNVLELIPQLKNLKSKVYIKLSPLFDIKEIWKVFDSVKKIHIIAEKGEIKEVGVCLDFNLKQNLKAIYLDDVDTGFSYVSINIPSAINSTNYAPCKFLLIPNSLLVKSRLADEYLSTLSISKHPYFQYYFSLNKIITQGTRTFEILGHFSISAKALSSELRARGIRKLTIVIKGLSDKSETWHKKLKTTDGGDFYLLILKSDKKESFLCKPIA